jgi:hypothetical protein
MRAYTHIIPAPLNEDNKYHTRYKTSVEGFSYELWRHSTQKKGSFNILWKLN